MKPKDIARMIMKMIEPIKRSIQLAIGRCVLSIVDDSKGIQVVKLSLLAGEVQDMERMQNYGFSSNPLPGAEGLAVFVGGNREHGICLVLDDRKFRIKNLQNGQVALYDAFGTNILLGNDGTTTVNAAVKTVVNSPSVEFGTGVLEKTLNGETF